jgi:hypothetical protein
VTLQRRIKELEAQNRALASVLVQQLQQGSPGQTISRVPAGGAGDEPLAGHSALSVSVSNSAVCSYAPQRGYKPHTETQQPTRLTARSQNCDQRLLASSYLSVGLSVCPHGITWLPLDGFSLNLVCEYALKAFVQKNKVLLKSDRNNSCFSWRPIHMFYHISLSSS